MTEYQNVFTRRGERLQVRLNTGIFSVGALTHRHNSSNYPFPCEHCKDVKPKGTPHIAVKPNSSSDTNVWVRFCVGCYGPWHEEKVRQAHAPPPRSSPPPTRPTILQSVLSLIGISPSSSGAAAQTSEDASSSSSSSSSSSYRWTRMRIPQRKHQKTPPPPPPPPRRRRHRWTRKRILMN